VPNGTDTSASGAPPAYGLNSLRSRVTLVLASLLLAMVAMSAYQAYRVREGLIANAVAQVIAASRITAQEQQGTVTLRVERILSSLTESRSIEGLIADPRCHDYLAIKLKAEPRFTNLAVIARNGDMVCAAVPTGEVVNLADREYFKQALKTRASVIGEPTYGRVSGKWTLPFAVASRDDVGRVRYVLLVALDLQWLSAQMQHTSYPGDARLGLIDQKGIVAVRYPDPERWVGRDASNTPFFKTLIAHRGSGTAEATGFDGVRRIYGFAHFAETVSGPLYLWIGVSKQSVVGDADRQFGWTIGGACILLTLLFGAAWFGGDRLILRPVWAISDAARRLANGDPDARTGVQYSKDELGQLARTFDEMAESLGSTNRLLQANEEIKKLNSSLEQRVRERTRALEAVNAELEAFAYSVSHDLRAPLRTIDGFSKILEEDYSLQIDEEGRDSLRRVRAAAQKMGHLIDDILKLSRLSRSEMTYEQVNLGQLADSIIAELKSADPAREVTVSIGAGLVALGDRMLIRILLENLLANAWKFTSKHPRALIEVGVTKKDGELAYFVRDDGAGFDMAHVGVLFAPFQRLHGTSEFPGTGIGLATVRRIVQRHGGRAWAEAEVEKGATFYFTLGAQQTAQGAQQKQEEKREREAVPA
jgi:signal transduction histidine kinase